MNIRKYRLTAESHGYAIGTFLYSLRMYDYGLSALDTKVTGRKHISVTLLPNGVYPFVTIPLDELEEVPYPEQPPGDVKRCGVGQGEYCCIFLSAGAEGFNCEKDGPMHRDLVRRQPTMNAKRIPKTMWPDCQLPSRG